MIKRSWLIAVWLHDEQTDDLIANVLPPFYNEDEAIEKVKDLRPTMVRVYLYVMDSSGIVRRVEGW